MKPKSIFLLLFSFLFFSGAQALPNGGHVVASLISENQSIQPGHPFWVGVHLKMSKGWHTYWKIPGDSGMPTRIKWTLPNGFQAGEIEWPDPKRIEAPPLVSFGYEDEVLLLVKITPPASIPMESVLLSAKVDWLECQEACIPGKAELKINLPVLNQTPLLDSSSTQLFFDSRNHTTANPLEAITPKGKLTLITAILFSFLGGLILNLMPCVLPVLSIKVLGVVKQSKGSRYESGLQGLLYTLGVILSFLVFAGIIIFLKEQGRLLGWGFQLQSPYFVGALAILFFVMALNLFGLFEVGVSLTQLGDVTAGKSGRLTAFLSGVLATIVATPCTAPFMGSALGFALTQSRLISLLVFFSLGFGMAFPFLLLSLFPTFLRFVPKPGPWMDKMKRVMGLLMLGTVVWLLWVIKIQVNFSTRSATSSTSQISWEPYSRDRVKTLREEGKAFFIDFTAAWCLTCQVNERVVFHSVEVINKVKDLNLVMLKADWTDGDPVITEVLQNYGRNGVPVYVLFAGEEKSRTPIVARDFDSQNISKRNWKYKEKIRRYSMRSPWRMFGILILSLQLSSYELAMSEDDYQETPANESVDQAPSAQESTYEDPPYESIPDPREGIEHPHAELNEENAPQVQQPEQPEFVPEPESPPEEPAAPSEESY